MNYLDDQNEGCVKRKEDSLDQFSLLNIKNGIIYVFTPIYT
jgi:hypothetical protein